MNDADSRPAVAGQVDRELGPLPEPDAMDEGYDFTRYSDDAMRAYAAQEVAAERERLAKECNYFAEALRAKGHAEAAAALAALAQEMRA